MKFHSSFSILFLTLAWSSRAGPLTTISSFRMCLADSGTDVDGSFFEYDDDPSSTYAYHNYQWELLNSVRTPAAYLLVKSAADVQNAVRCGKPLGVPLVPKGGGHSYEK